MEATNTTVVAMPADQKVTVDVEYAESCGETSEAPSLPSAASHWSKLAQVTPRPSSCCVFMMVLSIVTLVAGLTYYTVFGQSLKKWTDRFFASEKRLGEAAEKGEISLVEYDLGQWVFFVLLAVIFFINLFIIVPGLIVLLRRRFRSTTQKLAVARSLEAKPKIDAIVPCYLPNECEIIEETISHILNHVESPGELKLWVVYNTPKDMPELEARLQALASRVDLPHGRELVVVRADSSRSKAENINLLLPQLTGEYTVIYDADHHPDPESLMLMVEKIIRSNVACIQGSTYIRDLNSGIMARIVDAEFFVTHFVYFPTMKALTRNAVFCGSNGLWQTKVLQGKDFDPAMQTEDIDLAVRMLLDKHSIDFCPESRSGELAPGSLRALYKQRMRWAIGWDEVSIKLWPKMLRSDAEGTRKTAVAYILWSRWFMQVVGLIAGVLTPILSLIQRFDPDLCHCGLATQSLQTCMFYFFLTLVVGGTLEAIFQTHHRGLQSWMQVPFVTLFMVAGCVYIVLQTLLVVVSLFKISTGRVGGWVVTARNTQKSLTQTQKAADEETGAPHDNIEETSV